MKRFILPVTIILFFAACKNSGEKKDTNDTTTHSGHDAMHNMPPTSGGVPELPAVPDGAKVLFKNLKDNDMITSPFKLEMGTEVMRIDTAGPVVAGSGHHHLLINGPDSIPSGVVIPKDSLHIHFGKGQTDYELVLPEGKHKLTLQMADGIHRSYGHKLSATISVTVKK